jgi:hypothetical protein
VIDIALRLLRLFKINLQPILHIRVILDFFQTPVEYDLIVEQTFFCATAKCVSNMSLKPSTFEKKTWGFTKQAYYSIERLMADHPLEDKAFTNRYLKETFEVRR